MPMICSICRHPKKAAIDAALLNGEPLRTIAKRFGTSNSAVFRHGRDHIQVALVKAKEAEEQVEAGNLFERLRAINHETQAILREARTAGNNVVALSAIQRAEKQLELEAKLLGELDGSTKIAVGVNTGGIAVEEYSNAQLDQMLARLQGHIEKISSNPDEIVSGWTSD